VPTVLCVSVCVCLQVCAIINNDNNITGQVLINNNNNKELFFLIIIFTPLPVCTHPKIG